jgi:hypothetical protein
VLASYWFALTRNDFRHRSLATWFCNLTGVLRQGLDITEENLLLWSGRKAEVYAIAEGGVSMIASFDMLSPALGLYRTSVYAAMDSCLAILNLQVP